MAPVTAQTLPSILQPMPASPPSTEQKVSPSEYSADDGSGSAVEPLVFKQMDNGDWECAEGKGAVNRTGGTLKISGRIYCRLYDFQVKGVEWLWGMWTNGLGGGVLGDDMGMGKTVQCCAFLGAMWDSRVVGKILLVAPASLISPWQRALREWCENIPVHIMVGRETLDTLAGIERGGSFGIVLTTYETLRARLTKVIRAIENGEGKGFDVVILDEGHRIKNHKAQVSKAVREIPALFKVVVTGTPMQNNLTEFWAIFDFVTNGRLLGSDLKEFRARFEHDILRSRDKRATYYEKKIGEEKAQVLRELIAPHFLRRKKTLMVEAEKKGRQTSSGVVAPAQLPKKRDLVIWTKLSTEQEKLYRKFLQSKEVRKILDSFNHPFSGLKVCQNISDHPKLCAQQWIANMKDDTGRDDLDEISALLEDVSLDENTTEACLLASSKLFVMKQLLRRFCNEGHRTVVFSKSVKMLNIIEKVIIEDGYTFCRIDGSTPATSRQVIVDEFNNPGSGVSVMLITKGVGGVGLTLTGADRVILYDPAWNPVVDEQAVDRIYRIGQTNNVISCRLITCGTVEDKMYRRQVYKSGVAEMLTKKGHREEKSTHGQRLFSSADLAELFSYDPLAIRDTLNLLRQSLASACAADADLKERLGEDRKTIRPLQDLRGVVGISHHDLVQYTHQAVVEIVESNSEQQNNGQDDGVLYSRFWVPGVRGERNSVKPRMPAHQEFSLDQLPRPQRKEKLADGHNTRASRPPTGDPWKMASEKGLDPIPFSLQPTEGDSTESEVEEVANQIGSMKLNTLVMSENELTSTKEKQTSIGNAADAALSDLSAENGPAELASATSSASNLSATSSGDKPASQGAPNLSVSALTLPQATMDRTLCSELSSTSTDSCAPALSSDPDTGDSLSKDSLSSCKLPQRTKAPMYRQVSGRRVSVTASNEPSAPTPSSDHDWAGSPGKVFSPGCNITPEAKTPITKKILNRKVSNAPASSHISSPSGDSSSNSRRRNTFERSTSGKKGLRRKASSSLTSSCSQALLRGALTPKRDLNNLQDIANSQYRVRRNVSPYLQSKIQEGIHSFRKEGEMQEIVTKTAKSRKKASAEFDAFDICEDEILELGPIDSLKQQQSKKNAVPSPEVIDLMSP